MTKREVLLDGLKVGFAANVRMGTKGLDLAGKNERTSARLGVVERFDPDWVADQQQCAFAIVPESEGKHPIQTLDKLSSPAHQTMQQDLGVARRGLRKAASR